MRLILKLCGLSLLFLTICVGCGSKKADTPETAPTANADAPKADAAKADEPKADAPKADEQKADAPAADAQAKPAEPEKAKYEVTAPKRLHISDLKIIADRVHVDDMDGIEEPDIDKAVEPFFEFPAMYNNNNGQNEDDSSLWAESKGIFAGKAKDFYEALTKAEVIGPVSLTKNVTIDDLKQSDDGATYVMRIGKGDGFEDAYDMGMTIDSIYDKKERQVGWRLHGQKVGGSDNVAKSDLDILIYQLNANNCHIEYRNVIKGKPFSDDGIIQDRSRLFDNWAQISQKFADDFE